MTALAAQPDILGFLSQTELLRGTPGDTLRALLPWVELRRAEPGTVVVREGAESDGLYFVVSGRLRVTGQGWLGSAGLDRVVTAGECVGELAVWLREPCGATAITEVPSLLLRLPPDCFDRLKRTAPEAVVALGVAIDRHLRRSKLQQALLGSNFSHDGVGEAVLREIEAEMSLQSVRSGDVVIRQGDPGDRVYLVVTGRLRAVQLNDGIESAPRYVGRGETVGELGLVTGATQSFSVFAVRDSLLAVLTRDAFDRLLLRHPRRVLEHFVGGMIQRLVVGSAGVETRHGFNGVLALIPAQPDLPLAEFAAQLVGSMSAFGSVLPITPDVCDAALGQTGSSQAVPGERDDARLTLWLDEGEARHRYVIYQTQGNGSAWDERCMRQADRVLIVGRANAEHAPRPAEALLLRARPRESVTLILLHEAGTTRPADTARWLNARGLKDYHHIRSDRAEDFARLARLLTDNGTGLVIGGGGARAFAAIGVVSALGEAGIAIDSICGVSSGAVLGALLAMGHDPASLMTACARAAKSVDYTFPIHSLTSGRNWTAALRTLFGDARIEDLWLDFFCTSVNLTTASLIVHEEGSLLHAARASSAIPGILPPVWERGDLLVDGGLVNNLPVDLLRARAGVGRVLAVEVRATRGEQPDQFGYEISGWNALLRKVLPFTRKQSVPSMAEILMQSMLVTNASAANNARRIADFTFQPPAQSFGLMDWPRMREIVEVGYRYASHALSQQAGEFRPIAGHPGASPRP